MYRVDRKQVKEVLGTLAAIPRLDEAVIRVDPDRATAGAMF